jgi:replicative DNA helicase
MNAAVDRMTALYSPERAGLRVPPQAVQAEQSVLGGLMLSPDRLPDVAELLAPEDFYRSEHQAIYRAILALDEAKRPFDAVTVGEWFESHGRQEEIDGGAYPVQLASDVISAASIVHHAQIVADKARLRRLIEFGTDLTAAGFDPQGREVDELIDEAQHRIVELLPRQRGGLQQAGDSLGAWFADLHRRYEDGDRMTGMPTQWAEVNEVTRGIQPGELTIIAGRPSMGKSVAGLNLALFAAMRGVRTAFFSLEMSRKQCHNRNVASLARIPHDWVRAPGPTDDETLWTRLSNAVRDLRAAPLFIDDTPGLTVRQFEARARRLHRKQPIGLLVVDHIHDFTIDPKLARFEYGRIAQAIKGLAKEWHIPAVALAQLNRSVTGRAEKRPTLADLRESGELEQKGDLILFLHREDYYDTPDHKSHLQGVVELHVAKGRDMESGRRINLRNSFAQMRLDDWEGALPEPTIRPGGRWGRDRSTGNDA